MKICIIAPQDIESPSGVMGFLPIAKELAIEGEELLLLLLHQDFRTVTKRSFLYDKGINVKYVGQMFVRKRGGKKIYFSKFELFRVAVCSTLALSYNTLKERFDILEVWKPQPPVVIAGLLSKLLKRRPLVLVSDDCEKESNQLNSLFLKQILAFSERIMVRYSDAIITFTDFMADYYRKMCNNKKMILKSRAGISPGRFEQVLIVEKDLRGRLSLGNSKIVLFFGSVHIRAGKRVDILLKAFEVVVREAKNVKLLIVGSGQLEEMKALAKKLGICDKIIFTGAFPFEHLPSYVNLADVIVDPVDDSIANRAKASTRVRVGMLFGKPVITSNVGDRGDMLQDAGIFVPPRNSQALGNAIIRILKDEELAVTIGERGREKIKNFYWNNIVKDYVTLHNSLV